jgi:hypothetical protein
MMTFAESLVLLDALRTPLLPRILAAPSMSLSPCVMRFSLSRHDCSFRFVVKQEDIRGGVVLTVSLGKADRGALPAPDFRTRCFCYWSILMH